MTRLASNLASRWAGVWIALVLMLSTVSNVGGAPDVLQLVTDQEAAAAPEFRTPGGRPGAAEEWPHHQDHAADGRRQRRHDALSARDRVRAAPGRIAREDGDVLVKECNIPQGRHRVKLSVADREGNTTAEIIEMRVR